jgi:two-component system, NarL family, sensor kinase
MERAGGRQEQGPRRATAGLFTVGGIAIVVLALGSMLLRGRPLEVLYARWMLHNVPLAVVPLLIGWAIHRRWQGHGLARVFLGMGLLAALHVGFMAYTDARLVGLGVGTQPDVAFVPRAVPLDVSISFWLTSWLWIVVVGIGLALLLLLFPDGQLPSRRWWPVVALAGAATMLLVAGYTTWSWPWTNRVVVVTEQPSDIGIAPALLTIGWVLLLLAVGAGIASLVVRWRAASSEQRSQLRPVALSGSVLGVVAVALFPVQRVWIPAVLIALVVFLGSYVVAVLRFRLHELDVVVNRAVVASVLVALVTSLYLAVVVGVGSLIGRQVETPLLPLLAVGLIAVLFEPARRRVRQVVDRLLYGRDADAYGVLSELASQLRDAGSVEQVADQVASLLVRGSGASAARIHLAGHGGFQELAFAGDSEHPAVLEVPVLHDGELLGQVSLHARTATDLAPDAEELVTDVTGMLGAVLRNALLTSQLKEQVVALRRSRQRLVQAQDLARRDLERDLHDGAQSRLVALRLRVGLAGAELAQLEDGELRCRLQGRFQQLGDDVDEAIRELRVLTQGLRPPVLESDGVVPALRAATRGLPIAVDLDGDGVGRFPPAVEAAVYFACLEAVKNATTHARADRVQVRLSSSAGVLRFWIEDDGIGFDPERSGRGRGLENLDDRIGGLDGDLTVRSSPGHGTRIEGAVPAQSVDSAR